MTNIGQSRIRKESLLNMMDKARSIDPNMSIRFSSSQTYITYKGIEIRYMSFRKAYQKLYGIQRNRVKKVKQECS